MSVSMKGEITMISTLLLVVLAALLGLAFCFVGYRFFLVMLPIWGFFAGFWIGAYGTSLLLGTGFLGTTIALVVGVFRMRRKAPALERPYMAWGFPLTGIICLVGWVAIAIFVALMDFRSAAYSLALAVLSLPVFLWMQSRRGARASTKPVR